MNWYGTFEHGWTNEETGERMIFKERGEKIKAYIYTPEDMEMRGQRIAQGEERKEVIQQAYEFAREYEEEGWFEGKV